MVLYSKNRSLSFPRYGIAIPALESRFVKTLDSLRSHPLLSSSVSHWLQEEIHVEILREDLYRAHGKAYIDGLYGNRLEDFLLQAYELLDSRGNWNRYNPEKARKPLKDLLSDVLGLMAGTSQALSIALDRGFCYFLGGGMHHAHPSFGHGFCLLNDICVALLKAEAAGQIRRAWVIDMDAHRGDGTAEILAPHKNLISLSIHMAHGWPLDGPEYTGGVRNPGWFPGDVDIPMEQGEEELYLPRLMEALHSSLFDETPDLALVLGGADPYEKDELPSTESMKLTKEQLFQRDSTVYRFLEERKIPQVWLAAGGYGESSWEIHSQFLQWVLVERHG